MSPIPSAPVSFTLMLCLTLTALPGSTGPAPGMPRFSDARLHLGRSVWMRACRSCHLLGVDGVLGMRDFDQWEARLRAGRELFYRRVIAGMTRPDGTVVMPPRGGMPRLSDQELRAAVDYTLAALEALRR
jgi:cytochrome c5